MERALRARFCILLHTALQKRARRSRSTFRRRAIRGWLIVPSLCVHVCAGFPIAASFPNLRRRNLPSHPASETPRLLRRKAPATMRNTPTALTRCTGIRHQEETNGSHWRGGGFANHGRAVFDHARNASATGRIPAAYRLLPLHVMGKASASAADTMPATASRSPMIRAAPIVTADADVLMPKMSGPESTSPEPLTPCGYSRTQGSPSRVVIMFLRKAS